MKPESMSEKGAELHTPAKTMKTSIMFFSLVIILIMVLSSDARREFVLYNYTAVQESMLMLYIKWCTF